MSTSKQGALIFLHGLGDSPAGWSSLQNQLPRLQPRLANIEYVFPAAPIIPLSINGGAKMPGWFDLYDWPIEVGAKDDRTQKLGVGVATIQKEVDALVQRGIRAESIVVGGFSQGGAVALLAAYHPTERVGAALAGCASLSGWLTLVDDFKVGAASGSSTTPLFWGHGQYDDKVLFDHQAHGVQALTAYGVSSIEAHSYPMGHESDPDELVAMAKFVDQAIFGRSARGDDL